MYECEHPEIEEMVLDDRLTRIKHKIVVMSGKGGVGKSTVAANTAVALANLGYKTGLLDVDVHGPSIPTILGLEDKRLVKSQTGYIDPILYNKNLKVASIGFVLESIDSPVIWRGPAKNGFIKQMMSQVDWRDLDFLIVDCPPGTGDEPLSVIQILKNVTGAVIVTTPQKVATTAVRKSINFCKQLKTPIIGIIENMSGEIFKAGGGERMAKEMNVHFLGRIPSDQYMAEDGDNGTPFVEAHKSTDAAKNIEKMVASIKSFCEKEERHEINHP